MGGKVVGGRVVAECRSVSDDNHNNNKLAVDIF